MFISYVYRASAATSSIVTSLTDDTEEVLMQSFVYILYRPHRVVINSTSYKCLLFKPIFPRGNFGDGKVPDKPQVLIPFSQRCV